MVLSHLNWKFRLSLLLHLQKMNTKIASTTSDLQLSDHRNGKNRSRSYLIVRLSTVVEPILLRVVSTDPTRDSIRNVRMAVKH